MTTTPRGPKSSDRVRGSVRAGRTVRRASFLERNRTLVLILVGIVAVGAVGAVAFVGATSPAYACLSRWTPAETASPAPDATPRLGYVQPQMDRSHISPGDFADYAFCPPTSGEHVNARGTGPITPQVYGPTDVAKPQGWIHNLEHGGLVLLYRCEGGDGCTEAGQRALREFFTSFPASPICRTPPGPGSVGPIVAHFEEMAWPYAALLWGQVLPLEALDAPTIYAFFEQQGDRSNPEKQCPAPTPTPEPSATPTPVPATPTPEPSATPTPAAS